MLILIRILSVLVGAGTAWRVYEGTLAQPLFKIAYIVVAAVLVIAALLPRTSAASVMLAANAYALGVFSIGLASYLVPGRPVDPLLIAAMAVNLAAILLLMPRPASGHR